MENAMKVRIGGHSKGDYLIFDLSNQWMCGEITNGISVRFENELGGFVVDFKQLKDAIEKIEQSCINKTR